jgi:hypothetical protein
MDILRNLFGNLTSGIIRLAVTVGILAAVYFFIVKPVLSTTNDAIRESNRTFQKSFGNDGGVNLDKINSTLEQVNKTVEREIKKSFHFAKKQGKNDPKKLIRCIQRAHGDVNRIQRCTAKF